jgi:hypothetical protein
MNSRDREFDWNQVKIWNADGDDVPLTADRLLGSKLPGYECICHNDIKEVVTLTGNLEKALTHWISNAEFVFCCFAWLTNYRVLDALAALEHGCQVVVQKEDFLRPDRDHTSRSNQVLREKYEKLQCGFSRYRMPSIASGLSMCSDDSVDAVRCAGVANSERRRVSPRMHHKFAVACTCIITPEQHRDGGAWEDADVKFHPYSVWTGSFNPTSNGTKSRENAVVIDSESVANAYVNEWAKVFAVSEPLDWSSEWSAPEWRIGT